MVSAITKTFGPLSRPVLIAVVDVTICTWNSIASRQTQPAFLYGGNLRYNIRTWYYANYTQRTYQDSSLLFLLWESLHSYWRMQSGGGRELYHSRSTNFPIARTVSIQEPFVMMEKIRYVLFYSTQPFAFISIQLASGWSHFESSLTYGLTLYYTVATMPLDFRPCTISTVSFKYFRPVSKWPALYMLVTTFLYDCCHHHLTLAWER